MRRVYPKGLRITSSNLRPHIFWGAGSHVVALNWQTYDSGMQINEAMFVGTPGWVMKPDWMRIPGSGDHAASERRMKIHGKIVGVCNCKALLSFRYE
jgi:phosphatidylinositol phospholipase C delta